MFAFHSPRESVCLHVTLSCLSGEAECTKQTGCFLGVWSEVIPPTIVEIPAVLFINASIQTLRFSYLMRSVVSVTPGKLLTGERQACRGCVCVRTLALKGVHVFIGSW